MSKMEGGIGGGRGGGGDEKGLRGGKKQIRLWWGSKKKPVTKEGVTKGSKRGLKKEAKKTYGMKTVWDHRDKKLQEQKKRNSLTGNWSCEIDV